MNRAKIGVVGLGRFGVRHARVLPQYEMVGYRMDLVVQGIEGRLAVECDGDRWHGPERYEEDMARQRTLERCGLKFWRVRGSAFSLDSDGALKGLWKTLEREGIYPGAHRSPAEEQNEAAVTVPGTYIEHTQGTDHGSNARSPVEVEPQNNLTIKPASTKIATHGLGEPTNPVEKQRVEALQLADAAYITWSPSAHVPDPTKASPADLIPTLVEIVGTEGPMSVEQLYQIFVKGAGRQRVGRQSRRTLNKAVCKAIREGHVEDLNETGQSGMKGRILRTAASPSVVVRPRGNREFVEIPPSEVTTVMLRLERQDKGLSPEALYRAVLDFYDTKRMTTNIKERLKWIHERRVDLAAAESLDRRDLPEPGGQNQSS